MTPTPSVLQVDDLGVDFVQGDRRTRAVDGVSFAVAPGQVLALVGESGCGKSATATALAGLLPVSAHVSGSIRLDDRELHGLGERELARLRGRDMSMIFQDPTSSLNPVLSVGRQVAEPLRRHAGLSRREARRRAVELIDEVGIADPVRRAREYPHQLSGGMCQRVMIAIAIACNPRVLVADEPTTALDATVQATILELLRRLVAERGMALLLITHDLGVVADVADRVIVMYAGRSVEQGAVAELFAHPRHPYTRALLGATPTPGDDKRARLAEIPGMVPALAGPARDCTFAARCRHAQADCRRLRPELAPAGRHEVSCLHPEGGR
ncbi:ABC transporter ATP-binding protein [Conexibacter woesei]|uniref:Oligopeptide/dipeptide ABC transporter, ATPase subunit n=1 Tax=Conexibacter woesei (strain DSM 14684 / CCUG 47730 / CIP 108061 / JCM 11494 / NBRC 100937 / ID131577) TaxID=469383 RepID=D3F6Y8_CONWI|nr:ABC transporter ATP-binding protein [Conexibacter woesei]ADB52786.1 oligopeptide/dipeptide ABC transporter, ATPase subunit [Conexibacter woesei DSM 14684]